MAKIRKQHSKHLKFKASIELVKSEKTLSELCLEYGIHQSILQRWKKTLMDEGPEIFEDHRQKKTFAPDKTLEFERKIGQLTMEIDFLKKALGQ
jgi:transposase-like protein